MIASKRIAIALALAASVISVSAPRANANGYRAGFGGLGLVGPYGYAQDAWVDAYFGPDWGWNRPAWGYGYRGGFYRRAPVYGTTYAAPSYVDEDCRIQTRPTAYGWRRYRVCE
jgi:hypothetical protein